METFVSHERLLFGTRPSIADFGLYAQLGILLQDLTTGDFMRKETPRTISWVMRTADLSGLEGDWELDDTPSQILRGIFLSDRQHISTLSECQRPLRLGNNAPHFSTRLDGCAYEQPAFKYHDKCRNRLISKFEELNASERKRLRAFLADSGCLEALGRLHQA